MLLIITGSVLYFFIFLSNCDKNQVAKNQEILFEQKLKCNNLRPSVENLIRDYNSQQEPEQRSQNNTLAQDDPQQTFGTYLENKELSDFFYSPKLNTCLYIEIQRTSLKTIGNSELGGHIEYWNPVYEYYNFIDALTGKTINSIKTISRGSKFNSFNDVKKMVDDFQQGE